MALEGWNSNSTSEQPARTNSFFVSHILLHISSLVEPLEQYNQVPPPLKMPVFSCYSASAEVVHLDFSTSCHLLYWRKNKQCPWTP